MIFQQMLEARHRLTGPERKAFIKQINSLITKTGKFETSKVDAMIELLARAKSDVQDTLFDLNPVERKLFTGSVAARLKIEIERRMAEFEAQARGLMGRSQRKFAELGKEYTDALITSQAGVPPLDLGISEILIQNAATRSADLITSLSKRQIGQASDIINRGVITGRSPFQVAKDLAGSFDKGLSQMETIARTEMLGIHSQVQAAEFNELAKDVKKLKKQWITVLDSRTRETHRAVHLVSIPNNKTFQVGDANLRFPRDPAGAFPAEIINCFPGGTVMEGQVIGATKAYYRGELLTILTRQGFRLSITPNHPILTGEGFVAAHLLSLGDYILCHRAGSKRRPIGIDVDQEPTRIEDAFRTLEKTGTFRQSSIFSDFHGDGRFLDGDIKIVGPTGKLLADIESSRSQVKGHLVLEGTSMSKPKIASPRGFQDRSIGSPTSSHGLPGISALTDDSRSPFSLETPPFKSLSLGLAANINVSRYKMSSKSGAANPGFVADLLERGSGSVFSDKIIEIRYDKFSGQVYDLQSPFGWIVANGIFSSNCRCTMVPDFEDVTEEPKLSALEMPPPKAPLGGLARKVAARVRKIKR